MIDNLRTFGWVMFLGGLASGGWIAFTSNLMETGIIWGIGLVLLGAFWLVLLHAAAEGLQLLQRIAENTKG